MLTRLPPKVDEGKREISNHLLFLKEQFHIIENFRYIFNIKELIFFIKKNNSSFIPLSIEDIKNSNLNKEVVNISLDKFSYKTIFNLVECNIFADNKYFKENILIAPFYVKNDLKMFSYLCINNDFLDFEKVEFFLKLFHDVYIKFLENNILTSNNLNSCTELQTVLDGIAEGIIITDLNNKIININKTALNMLGKSGGVYQYYEKKIEDIIDHRDISLLIIETINNPGLTLEKEITIKRDNDKDVILLTKSKIIEDISGFPVSVVTVLRDITLERELEIAKDSFISIVSHELRTPLTLIKGYAGLMILERLGPLIPEYRKFLSVIKKQTDNLINTIDNLLEVSRFQSDKLTHKISSVDIKDLWEDIINKFSESINDKKIRIRKHIEGKIPYINTDKGKIEIVLSNLLGNAIKFVENNGEIVLYFKERENDFLLSVKDNGCGIPESEQNKIFNRFYQIDSSLNRKTRGIGIGLYLVKYIVDSLGGKVWVKSTVGKGSEFFIKLPKISGYEDEK